MLLHVVVHPGTEGLLPTVIGLHGHGASANELAGLEPHLAGGRALWVLPQGEFQNHRERYGFTWVERDVLGQLAANEPRRAVEAVTAFIDQAIERYPIDPDRVVLMGFSMGAALALSVAMTNPRRFAGLAVLSGYLSDDLTIGLELGEGIEQLPVLIQHGTNDPVVDIAHVQEAVGKLRRLGAAIEYQEYPMGHEIGIESVAAFSHWLGWALRIEA